MCVGMGEPGSRDRKKEGKEDREFSHKNTIFKNIKTVSYHGA